MRLARDTVNDKLVALKIMQKEWIWKNDMSSLVRREINIMKGIYLGRFLYCVGF